MKPSPLDAVREMYEATAESYAEMMNAEIKLPVYSEVLERLQCGIDGLPGALVDTACGSGHMLSMSGGIREAMKEWHRVLFPRGQLWVAAWEGAGLIDYGEASDIVAIRYSRNELIEFAEEAGFKVNRCVLVPVEDFPMDAVHLECIKQPQPS